MMQDRAIYDNAVSVRAHEFQEELDAVDRLRRRSLEVQRNIEVLVEARDHARAEAMASAVVKRLRPMPHEKDKRGVIPRPSDFANNYVRRSKS